MNLGVHDFHTRKMGVHAFGVHDFFHDFDGCPQRMFDFVHDFVGCPQRMLGDHGGSVGPGPDLLAAGVGPELGYLAGGRLPVDRGRWIVVHSSSPLTCDS